jgi:hypothetical protein
MGHLVDPDVIFAPVKAYLDSQPCTTIRLERTLARARYAIEQGRDPTKDAEAAANTLALIAKTLNDTDRAALHLHPWSREVRLAGTA